MRAVRVEIALTTTIAAIHSGSCSYVIGLESETTGIAVPFSIATFDVCACVRAIYIDSQYGCFDVTVARRFRSGTRVDGNDDDDDDDDDDDSRSGIRHIKTSVL